MFLLHGQACVNAEKHEFTVVVSLFMYAHECGIQTPGQFLLALEGVDATVLCFCPWPCCSAVCFAENQKAQEGLLG